MRLSLLLAVLFLAAPATAAADKHACLERLDALDVPYHVARARSGIAVPVEVTGPLGGVRYRTWRDVNLVLDCSLVYSLAMAGRYLAAAGVVEAFYSSAYQVRNVRGTGRPSKHGNGLAIDVHEYWGDEVGRLAVQDDYEQGLGDAMDCIGAPLTTAGSLLRRFFCQFDRSGLFRLILSPDYDQDHYNHFNIEALPWEQRKDVSGPLPPRLHRAGGVPADGARSAMRGSPGPAGSR